VFDVLPRAFTEMPGGRFIGTLFFLLLVFAALMPSIASIEPPWLGSSAVRNGQSAAVLRCCGCRVLLGIGSVLSFNLWSAWHPVAFVPFLSGMTFFGVMDYVSAKHHAPRRSILTSVLGRFGG